MDRTRSLGFYGQIFSAMNFNFAPCPCLLFPSSLLCSLLLSNKYVNGHYSSLALLKLTLQLRQTEGDEEVSSTGIWGKVFQAEGRANAKALE